MYMPWHIGLTDASTSLVDILVRRMGSSFAGDILRILASHKGCLESFWQSIHWSFGTNHIQQAAVQLRNGMETILLPCSNHLSCLAGRYSREQVRQIKYVVEVFYTMEPIFAILAGLAQRWIAQQYSGNAPTCEHIEFRPDVNMPMCLGKIDFLDESHCVGMPHLFYRALAKWPDYATLIAKEVGNARDFAENTRYAMYRAEFLSESINMSVSEPPLWIDEREMERSIRCCREVSANAIVTATMLRKGFIVGEKSEREKHALEERWAER